MKYKWLSLATAGILLAACGNVEGPKLLGERLTLDGKPVAQAQNKSVATALGAQRNIQAWPQRAGNAQNNMQHASFGSAPAVIWEAAIGQGNERKYRITADPVAENGRIFAMDSHSLVTALSTAGEILWQTDVSASYDRVQDASGGGLAVSGNRLFVTNGFGELLALNTSDGSIGWKQNLQSIATGAPTLANGMIYVALRDGRAVTVDPKDGRLKWQVVTAPSETGVGRGASIGVDNRVAVLPFSSAHITGVFAKGGYKLWDSSAAGGRMGQTYSMISDISGDPVISGSSVYVASPAGRTVALDKNEGTLQWVAEEGAVSPMVVTSRSLYMVNDVSQLVRLDRRNGARIWATQLPKFKPKKIENRQAEIFAHFGPVLAGGRLWVASADGRLRSFDARDGRLISEQAIGAGAAARPIIMNGMMYVVTLDGKLLALR